MACVPIWTLMPVITMVLLLLVTSRVKPPGYRERTGTAQQAGMARGSASPPAGSQGASSPSLTPARSYLGVGHVHAGGVETVLDLLGIVDLQEVVAPKLHVCQLLVVFKEVDGEVHLGGAARGWRERAATEQVVNGTSSRG